MRPFKLKFWRVAGTALIPKGGLQGKARERPRYGPDLMHIHAAQPATLSRRELHRTNTFNQEFAGFTLGPGKREHRRFDFRFLVCSFKRDQKLMIASNRLADVKHEHAFIVRERIERWTSRLCQFETGRQRHSEFTGFALDHGNVA